MHRERVLYHTLRYGPPQLFFLTPAFFSDAITHTRQQKGREQEEGCLEDAYRQIATGTRVTASWGKAETLQGACQGRHGKCPKGVAAAGT